MVFRAGWSLNSESYPLIRGVVSKNPYGEFITLRDCFTTQKRLSSAGIGSETIHCNQGIAGDTHLAADYDEFEILVVKISYLDEWFGRRGFTTDLVPGEGFGLDVRYRKPDSVRFPIDQSVLKLGMTTSSTESFHTLTISEQAHFAVEPLPRLSVSQLFSKYISPLRNLMSFATDTPNAIEEVKLQGKMERNREYYLLTNPIFRLKKKKDRIAPGELLFSFEEAQEAGIDPFQSWFEFSRKHEAFCTVFFAFIMAPPKYLDEKLLRLMSAVHTSHHVIGRGS